MSSSYEFTELERLRAEVRTFPERCGAMWADNHMHSAFDMFMMVALLLFVGQLAWKWYSQESKCAAHAPKHRRSKSQ